MRLVERYYQQCRRICREKYGGGEWEDYFHDTCILVASESCLPDDMDRFCRYFAYRYNMVVYQMQHDKIMRKEENYADNLQVAEEEEELFR